ncbi:hypothetical protein [Flaviaesturariibacter terrae]
MTTYKNIQTQYKPKEIAESFVFPAEEKDREQVIDLLKEVRQKANSNTTDEEKIISKLLQLKFIIEDYLSSDTYNSKYHFGFFLKEYIARLEKKNKELASEIDIEPTELSQLINQHREPNEKIIIRLEIHSNKSFPAILWYRLIEKQKEYELMTDDGKRQKEMKHVKQRLEFSL